MKTSDLIRRAARSLSNAKVRTLLTSLAIAVGAFTLTLTLAASAGANHYAKQLISSNFDPAVVLVGKDDKLFGGGTSGFDTPQEFNADATDVSFGRASTQYQRLTDTDITAIAKTPGVESVTPSYEVTPQYVTRTNQKKYTASVMTYSPGQRPTIGAGTLPAIGTQLKDGSIVLPESYVAVLGFSSLKAAVGQTVTLHLQRQTSVNQSNIQNIFSTQGLAGLQHLQQYQTEDVAFTIAAVATKSSTSISASPTLLVSQNDAKSLSDFQTTDTADYHKYLTADVRVKDGDNTANLNRVKSALVSKGYTVETAEDLQKTLLQVVAILQGIVTGFSVIALIASLFGIINTQYISVLERTREIGLMKALGMRKIDVGWLFRIEAAWIGFLGGIIGAGLAFIAGTLLNPWLNTTLDLGAGNYILIFQIWPIIGLIAGLMIIAILAGWLPARKAAKLDPIEALRTE